MTCPVKVNHHKAQVLFLFGVIAGVGRSAHQGTDQLVNSLRRQLMTENYDYMEESDSFELTTQAQNEKPVMRAQHTDGNESHETTHESNDVLLKLILNDTEKANSTHHNPIQSFEAQKSQDENVSKNDFDSESRRAINFIDVKDTGTNITTTVRYKLLEMTMKPNESGRRIFNAPSRRFLQEERPDHIAIVPLDPGPIPEFRLPRSRRQYMGDYDRSDQIPDVPEGALMDPYAKKPPARRFRAPLPVNSEETTEGAPNISEASSSTSLEDEIVNME